MVITLLVVLGALVLAMIASAMLDPRSDQEAVETTEVRP
jgi:hypothetical protein